MKKLLLTLALTSALVTAGGAYAQMGAPVSSASNTTEHHSHDGHKAYAYYFQNFYHNFSLLADDGQAEEFKKIWEHKYDADGQLDSTASAKVAINALAEVGSRVGCPEKFDGACLYRRAFRAYMQFHYHPEDGSPELVDPAQRAKWAAEWEHKFDGSPDLLTEAGADSAIRKMRDSLGQRFDYVYSVAQTKSEHDTMRANFAGIGVPIILSNDKTMKLAAPLQLIAHEPPANSPAHGLVHFGDVVVSIGGKPVSNMTNEEAQKSLFGPLGSHETVSVKRTDKNGKVETLDFDITRAYVVDPLSTSIPSGDATVGIPIELKGTKELKLGGDRQMEVEEPYSDSPARGKLHEGDIILAADGASFDGMTMNEGVDKIRGPAGTRVELTILPKGETEKKQVFVVRRTIQQHAVHFVAMPKDVGFISVDQFSSQNVPDDYAASVARTVLPLVARKLAEKSDALSQAKAAEFNALKRILDNDGILDDDTLPIAAEASKLYDDLGVIGGGVIVDLRSNPGGDLQVFHALANLSLRQGTIYAMPRREPGTDNIIVHEEVLMPDFEMMIDHPEGAGPQQREMQTTARRPLLVPATMPMVVLINGKSASASELFSGMMQANRRAILIGESSLGKGVGQTVVDLPYGRSLHVTTFEFLPGGMKSDWSGVIVDRAVSRGHGKTDAQVDAALAAIDQANERASTRVDAVAASLKLHRQFFGAETSNRDNEDSKPIGEQDTSRLH